MPLFHKQVPKFIIVYQSFNHQKMNPFKESYFQPQPPKHQSNIEQFPYQPVQQPNIDQNLQQKTKKLYYKYCCNSCIHLEGSNKSCVCIVPRSKRKKTIGDQGCQTCACRGCTAEDDLIRKEQERQKKKQKRERSRSRDKHFRPENGCCEKCIRALSKNRKACLCQVPKSQRKTKLPAEGCKLCGCHGCHPRDFNDKYEYSSEQYSNYELSEEMSEIVHNEKDLNNIDKSVIGQVIANEYSLYGPMLGLGIPQRTPSYILGRPI